MTLLYSLASLSEIERLEEAWPDAPTEQPEICGMILDVAGHQVLSYAGVPAVAGAVPVIVEYVPAAPPGIHCLYTFSRTGDVVTVTAVITSATYDMGSSSGPITVNVPVGFRLTDGFWSGTDWYINVGSVVGKIGARAEKGKTVTRTISYSTGDPMPAAVGDVPVNLVYAQLQQAKNLWNAGRAQADGNVGGEGYTFIPRPLDKTIQQIIRPRRGVPNVF